MQCECTATYTLGCPISQKTPVPAPCTIEVDWLSSISEIVIWLWETMPLGDPAAWTSFKIVTISLSLIWHLSTQFSSPSIHLFGSDMQAKYSTKYTNLMTTNIQLIYRFPYFLGSHIIICKNCKLTFWLCSRFNRWWLTCKSCMYCLYWSVNMCHPPNFLVILTNPTIPSKTSCLSLTSNSCAIAVSSAISAPFFLYVSLSSSTPVL